MGGGVREYELLDLVHHLFSLAKVPIGAHELDQMFYLITQSFSQSDLLYLHLSKHPLIVYIEHNTIFECVAIKQLVNNHTSLLNKG